MAKSPFPKKVRGEAVTTWVKPTLVAEVKFTEWTNSGEMRHPVYLGLTAQSARKRSCANAKRRVSKIKPAGRWHLAICRPSKIDLHWETGYLGPQTNRPNSPSGQKRSPRRPKRSRKSLPIAGFDSPREIFRFERLRGGLGRTRTSNQTVMVRTRRTLVPQRLSSRDAEALRGLRSALLHHCLQRTEGTLRHRRIVS